MQIVMKNFLRILYILFFIIAGMWVIFHPAKTETNLLRAVYSNNFSDELIVKLSGRYSSKINVLVEASSPEKASQTAEEFLASVDKNSFDIQAFDFAKILSTYKKYNNNLLANSTAKLLEDKKYDEVTAEAYNRLLDPFGVMLVPLNEDPFMLFEDYVKSLGSDRTDSIEYNEKYYKILSLEVNNELSLSPDVINSKIKTLTDLQAELSNQDVQIYLTGTPIHSYYASSRSMVEINIICVLSSLFILGICYFYFRNLKLLLPIAISLGGGILAGYLLCAILFSSIHVLTFVFSTTLIGICIDYSLHYFIEKDLAKIFKSLTVSMITTVSAFGILLFSGVELLKQIAVFTMTGLFTVYLAVVLFYPLLKLDLNPRKINFSVNDKFKKIFAVIVLLVSLGGICCFKFNDDIRNLYVPSKKLLNAEKLFAQITGGNVKTSFAVVDGDNMQEILEKEEIIAQHLNNKDYQALSKFVPSIKQQKRNFELRKELYKNELNKFGEFLTPAEKQKLINANPPADFLEYTALPALSEFLPAENTSIMVLYDIKDPSIITQNGGQFVDVTQSITSKIRNCRISCVKMLLPIFIILFALLAFIYKPKTALKIITPSVMAAVFSVCLVSLTGQEINLFHILAIFLIVGFGLDYSVFRASGIKSSSDAVLLSCLTSILSFLLLAFTSFKLISSLGFILSAGLTVSYLGSLLFDYKKENAQ